MFIITDSESHSVSLIQKERKNYGDVVSTFKFNLGWATGSVRVVASSERMEALSNSIDSILTSTLNRVEFINEDGNLDISLLVKSGGVVEFRAVAMPNMIDEDRIEIYLCGEIKSSPYQHDYDCCRPVI